MDAAKTALAIGESALGEAGEQNAPLGRAVIGGLVLATVSTLFVVPVVYTLMRRRMPTLHALDDRFERESRGEKIEFKFVGIDKARFRKPVEPGDQLILKVKLVRPLKGIWKFDASADVRAARNSR